MAACDENVDFSWCIECKEQLASSVPETCITVTLKQTVLAFNCTVPAALVFRIRFPAP